MSYFFQTMKNLCFSQDILERRRTGEGVQVLVEAWTTDHFAAGRSQRDRSSFRHLAPSGSVANSDIQQFAFMASLMAKGAFALRRCASVGPLGVGGSRWPGTWEEVFFRADWAPLGTWYSAIVARPMSLGVDCPQSRCVATDVAGQRRR